MLNSSTIQTLEKLVNDLDLELISPDGTVILPWVLDRLPIASNLGDKDPISASDVIAAHRGVDHRNNVEMVSLKHPTNGRWKVKVSAHSLPFGDIQKYTIVGSHSLTSCSCSSPYFPKRRSKSP